ncbi:MAG: hypothetical protein H0W82_08815 [Actinobacteria bacterium]|nr:hypothetical protein [Actinomycetota bacterium]
MIFGYRGPDHLLGGLGSDYLFAGRGADVMRGGKGNDGCLNGVDGRPVDALFGGPGTDRFDADAGGALSSVEAETFRCFEGQ